MYPNKIDGKCIAIGDIHGEHTQIKQLLNGLMEEDITHNRWVVFLGDYVDRGPNTAETIELLINFNKLHPKSTFCCGNHDLSLLKGLGLVNNPHQDYYRGRFATRNVETACSYGAKNHDELAQKMPDSHKEFLKNLCWCVEHPYYLFVHSGLDPFEPYQQQINELDKRDCNLFRPKWLHKNEFARSVPPTDANRIIISGHRTSHTPLILENHISIDTGAGFGGPITAVILPSKISHNMDLQFRQA
jgi:serine/threonine protein phosphatase 1